MGNEEDQSNVPSDDTAEQSGTSSDPSTEATDEELDKTTILPVERDDIEGWYGELADIADESGFDSIEREIKEEQLPAFRAGEMSVVVLGEFNHGKSTVINALLGEQVLPVGITPTTSVITHLTYGDEPKAIAQQPRGGDQIDIDYDDLDAQIRRVEKTAKEPEYVEISYPNDLLKDSLLLVDTPGVNDISQQKVEITYGYLPKADVLIYVLDATQILKKSEIAFIEEKLLNANEDRIIFVLGKTDAIDDDDLAEVKEYAREKLHELVGDVPLFSFSATEALEAQKKDEPTPTGFREFRDYLLKFLREQRGFILMDSALSGGLRVAGLMEQNLAIKKQSYLLEKEELEERLETVHNKLEESKELVSENVELIDERISEIASTARHNLDSFCSEFKNKLPQQIERADAKDVKLYLSNWIQDSFREWLQEEGTRVGNRLEELAEEIIEITNESMRETVEELRDELGLRGELDLDVDTIAYDVSVFALGTLGVSAFFFANAIVGGLLTLSTPILAVVLKGKVDEKIKERAKEEGLQAIDEAHDAIEEELNEIIYDFGDRLKEFVENAGDRLYQQIEDVLEQVQREVEDKEDREALAEDVEERIEQVRRIAEEFEVAQTELRAYEETTT